MKTWALYAPCLSSSSKLSLSSTRYQQHKCVICYPLAPIARVQMGIMTYKISTLQIQSGKTSKLNKRKMVVTLLKNGWFVTSLAIGFLNCNDNL